MNDKRAKDIMTTDVIVANKNDIIANSGKSTYKGENRRAASSR